jgi:DMSO/TMAO reductase YedYZ molybdopterin-dependent catalytic subunit
MIKPERGLEELYRDDPERADALVFGRRGMLGGAALAAMGAAIGAALPFARSMPTGFLPAALAQQPAAGPKLLRMDGKAPLVILGDRPLVAETPEHMLDDEVTPTDRIFVRNNGQIPEPRGDADAWELTIDGEVDRPLTLRLGEIKQRFANVSAAMQMECGGNGRGAFQNPQTSGNQWGNGAICNPLWTGVRLADVLRAAGLKSSAVHTANVGADPHLSGDATRLPLSRGVPLAKAMDEDSLLVWAVNGQPLPLIHGAPLRLIHPGWPGSASHKWLTRITVRDKQHDGPGMTGTAYRVPILPMIPGDRADPANMAVMTSMPVRNVITAPATATEIAVGTRRLAVRGHAWAGDRTVRAVDVSIDYGASWRPATVAAPANRHAWQRWSADIDLPFPAQPLPRKAYLEVWARATDSDGRMQPHVAGNWNPQGYGANPINRIQLLLAG